MDAGEVAGEVIADRRQYPSRRAFSWSTALFGFLRSHRRTLRRAEDADSLFTDWHHPWLFFLAVGIMLLSCVDAFMTLRLLEHGMVEANPVMAAMLDQGVARFSASKFALTGIGVLILVFLARTVFLNLMRTGVLLTFFFSIYSCLVCYQFVHLLRVL
jgi:hypothetical protein